MNGIPTGSMLELAVRGLQDSLQGVSRIYQLDVAQRREAEARKTKQNEERPSILAQRRQQDPTKAKHRPDSSTQSEPRVLQRILMCCAWNGGVFWLSILSFHGVLLPLLQLFIHCLFGESFDAVWGWISPAMTCIFSALWIIPLFLLSKIVNSLWFQDIADTAYIRSRGRPRQMPSLSRSIADILFSLLMETLFLIQAGLVSMLPIPMVGQFLSMLHICLLYSLYAFEYKWFNMGWEVHKRVSYIESNWTYFIGFGLPLGILTSLPSSQLISGCVFSILFPLFIISANEAQGIDTVCEIPLRLFSPVVGISDTIFRLSVKKGNPSVSKTTSSTAKHTAMKNR